MVAFTVPAGRYAVFTHRGPIADFHLTVRKIWKEWLPASGLEPTGAPDVEVYDERFKLHEADSECDMLVPVK
jgi:AraC family transcriptional regulator